MIEGSGSGSGSIPLTNGSGSMKPKNMWIRWIRIRIRIRNTVKKCLKGSYSIHFGLSSANWCGSGSNLSLWLGSGSSYSLWCGSSLSLWCGCGSIWIRIRTHNTGENTVHHTSVLKKGVKSGAGGRKIRYFLCKAKNGTGTQSDLPT